MRESIWKGSLSFGLVNIPVSLRPAESRQDLQFSLLDRRDMSPVGYRKVNKSTGQEVPSGEVVKGYEYAENQFVVLTDEDFKRAAAERSQRIEISAFVDAREIAPPYFDKPYYLEPAPKSEKPYALLREAMKRSGKAGVSSVVIARREHLAAVLVQGPVLILELLRFAHELRDPSDLHVPQAGDPKVSLSEGELKMAERLIGDLAGPWKPEQYGDRYHQQLLDLIQRKAEGGLAEAVAVPEPQRLRAPADIMALLKESVARAEKAGARGSSGGRGEQPGPARGRKHGRGSK